MFTSSGKNCKAGFLCADLWAVAVLGTGMALLTPAIVTTEASDHGSAGLYPITPVAAPVDKQSSISLLVGS